jgi:hypothetical protein
MTAPKQSTATESRRAFIRQALASMSASALAGCGAGHTTGTTGTTGTQLGAAMSAAPTIPSTFAVSAEAMASIAARPENFLIEYQALGGGSRTAAASTLRKALGSSFTTLTDTGCLAVYAAIVAASAAPVGDPGFPPMDASLRRLLHAPELACGHYCKLAVLLALLGRATLSPPDLGADSGSLPGTVNFLVWLDTVPLNTGYHSQLVVSNVLTNAWLLLDPLYGFALAIPFGSPGPQSGLTAIENAATSLMEPIKAQNLVQFNDTNLGSNPTITQLITSGDLGPQYIYHDSIYGSEGWDTRIAQVIGNLG